MSNTIVEMYVDVDTFDRITETIGPDNRFVDDKDDRENMCVDLLFTGWLKMITIRDNQ